MTNHNGRLLWHARNSLGTLRRVTAVTVLLSFGSAANAQNMSCGNALFQLQQYVARVNQVASWEFYQGIPQRCGFNGFCAQGLMQQLNYWYAQETSRVNQWYYQIAQTCSQGAAPVDLSLGGDQDEPPQIDEDEIEDLEVDDEDRTVRIRIPSTPSGFRPR
jgi:hypothetical protein